MRTPWLMWVLNPTSVIRSEEWRGRDTQKRPCEDTGRGWSYTVTNRGMLRISSSPPKWAERHGTLPTPWFQTWPPELWKNQFLMFQATQFVNFCYRSHRKCIQVVKKISLLLYLGERQWRCLPGGKGKRHGQMALWISQSSSKAKTCHP